MRINNAVTFTDNVTLQGGEISLDGAPLSANGQSVTLRASSGDITLDNSTIDTSGTGGMSGGNVTLTTSGDVRLSNSAINVSGGVGSFAGNIAVNASNLRLDDSELLSTTHRNTSTGTTQTASGSPIATYSSANVTITGTGIGNVELGNGSLINASSLSIGAGGGNILFSGFQAIQTFGTANNDIITGSLDPRLALISGFIDTGTVVQPVETFFTVSELDILNADNINAWLTDKSPVVHR